MKIKARPPKWAATPRRLRGLTTANLNLRNTVRELDKRARMVTGLQVKLAAVTTELAGVKAELKRLQDAEARRRRVRDDSWALAAI